MVVQREEQGGVVEELKPGGAEVGRAELEVPVELSVEGREQEQHLALVLDPNYPKQT